MKLVTGQIMEFYQNSIFRIKKPAVVTRRQIPFRTMLLLVHREGLHRTGLIRLLPSFGPNDQHHLIEGFLATDNPRPDLSPQGREAQLAHEEASDIVRCPIALIGSG